MTLHEDLVTVFFDVLLFAEFTSMLKLRNYQEGIAKAIVDSVFWQKGLTFVVILPRQSGKNETQAQIEAFLIRVFSKRDEDIVKISPTWKPQSLNAMARLERVMNNNNLTKPYWGSESGYIYRIGKARITFLSGEPHANIVGATSSLLQEVDEAQDVEIEVYDKKIAPMAASTNATRVFWGTAWTSKTLLAREMRAALEEQKKDGIQRVFMITADEVAEEVPAYGKFVAEQVAKLGRQHPLIKTQYFSEEIDAQCGMFNDRRRALMVGDREPSPQPSPEGGGRIYAFLIDVAGMDESPVDLEGMSNPGRDSETLGIVEVDLSSLAELQKPTYRVIKRQAWTGMNHLQVFGQIKALADIWKPQYIVIDATGVGEGQWAMLDKAFPTRVIPVKFSGQSKSEIGWQFIGVIETGRFRDCATNDDVRIQYENCQSEILEGPAHTMRWGVKDGTRVNGKLVHDDYILSDSLVVKLDELEWTVETKPDVIHVRDPLEDMSKF